MFAGRPATPTGSRRTIPKAGGPTRISGRLACLGCADAKTWAAKTTQRIIAENKLDYFKNDWCPIVTKCNKKTHRHRYGVDVSYWSTLGFYEIYDMLRRTFPNLILEHASASGSGGIKDFGVIQRSHYTYAIDKQLELPNRRIIYDLTFAFPPLLLQCVTLDFHPGWAGNYPPYAKDYTKGDVAGPFLWRSAMMSAFQVNAANVENWTPAQVQSLQKAVKVYREWIRPILHDATGPPHPSPPGREALGRHVLLESELEQGHSLYLPAKLR